MRETPETIEGPAGALEARVAGLEELRGGAGVVALVCHPHPLFGGTMQNKVVTTVARVWRDRGVPVARFNFRGVGRSEGSYGEGAGEADDVRAVAQWLWRENPAARLALAGFSFGSYAAARAAHELLQEGRPVQQLVMLAPSVVNFDYTAVLPLAVPTMVMQGDADEVVDPEAVLSAMRGLNPPPQVEVFPACSHFFHGRLVELKERLQSWLDAQDA